MQSITQLAIANHRQAEQARLSYVRAEARSINSARLVPAEDLLVWLLYTELSRLDLMARESESASDWVGVEWCKRRKDLRTEEYLIERIKMANLVVTP